MMRPISVEVDGKTYSGDFEVRGRVVTVTTSYGTKSTQVGGSPPDVVAKTLLRELVRQHSSQTGGSGPG